MNLRRRFHTLISSAIVTSSLFISTAIVAGSLFILSACVPQMMLNYALKRDANKDSLAYVNYWNAFNRDSANQQWTASLRDTFIVSHQDGARLHALYRPAATPTTRTVVFFHGYGGSAARFLGYGRFYNEDLGLNLLMPDFHAHGLSEGKMRQMGWLDRNDMLQWMQLADSLFRGDAPSTQMLVTGVSMGGATTMMVSGEVENRGLSFVKCFIEDCGYTTVWDQFNSVLKGKHRWLLNWSNKRCRKRYGWDFHEASALDAVKRCHLPMLFIHGGADTYVPTSMVREVYGAKSNPKDIWIPAGIEHALSFDNANAEYRRHVTAFLKYYLP